MRVGSRNWIFAAAGILALLLFHAIVGPDFLRVVWQDGRLYGSLVDVLLRAAPIVLIALGMTLVIGTGGVDLSVGAVMAISAAVAACIVVRPADSPLSQLGLPPSAAMAIVASLAAGLASGLFNGALAGLAGIQPIVATLVLMVAGRGVAQLFTNGQIVTFENSTLEAVGSGSWAGLPNPVWIAGAAVLAVWLLVRRTGFGLLLEAAGSNARAARLVGIDERRIKLAAYALTGLLAGVAGLIACADIKGADANNAGLYIELDAILAVCLGGTSLAGGRLSLVGTVLGAVLMQLVATTMLNRGVPPPAALVAKASVILALCVLQSPRWSQMGARRRAA